VTGTPGASDAGGSEDAAVPDPAAGPDEPAGRKRRGKRVAVLAVLSALVVAAAAVAVGFVVVNNLAGRIPRTPVSHLVLPEGGASQTILITGAGFGPTGSSAPSMSGAEFSGLIMILHINIDKRAGGVVSIPPLAVVPVPGVGQEQLWDALTDGGPTLLVQTVAQLTGVPINHYARVDFDHVARMIDAAGGVDVDIQKPSVSFGYKFHAGVNQLNGVTSLYYVRDQSLTEAGRVLRQQNLIRAILFKVASRHLLTDPVKMVGVLSALTSMLTVDSNFTNSSLMLFARDLGSLSGKAGTFLTVPSQTTNGKVLLDAQASGQLWQAIKDDSISQFVKKYPLTITPAVVP
jgi:LCP family protein required for cell wall assembly